MEAFVFAGGLEAKPLTELIKRLHSRPYGLTEGVIPILVYSFLFYHESEVAIYEEGRFVTDWDTATFERITKRPELYTLQGCKISGERLRVLERFARGLLRSDEEVTLVNVVRQLYRAFKRLPEYTLRTRRLDAPAQNLRNLFRESREPEHFLFVDLPSAFGARPFTEQDIEDDNVDHFFHEWNRVMTSLHGAYPDLLNRIEEGLRHTFEIKGYEDLRTRSEAIANHLSEKQIKGFVTRASDRILNREKWLESVGQVVLGRPPHLWSDAEEERFYNQLPPLALAFRHSELIQFERGQTEHNSKTAMRLAVTLDTGHEDSRVIFISEEEQQQVRSLTPRLRCEVDRILEGVPEGVRLAILGHLTQDLLKGDN